MGDDEEEQEPRCNAPYIPAPPDPSPYLSHLLPKPITFLNRRPRKSDKRRLLGEGPRCIFSDPAQPHNVSSQAVSDAKHDCAFCGKKSESGYINYYCTICDVEFHKRCLETPSRMIHPYHPQHLLSFTFLNYETGMISDTNYGEFSSFLQRSGLDMSQYLKSIVPKSNIMFDKCTWCRHELGQWFYRCSICNFSLDFHCASSFPPLTIQNPKNHHHSLNLFPRPLFVPCDACGLIDVLEPSYACYQCNLVVHESCIDLPRVIKITRHLHRLSHSPCLPAKVLSCRVCYKNADIRNGQYSCNHEDCCYVVHSKCATHKKIGDGRELEWKPEESEAEDISPFKNVGVGLIQHYCHGNHVLRLEKYDGIREDSGKQCQACIRPIKSQDFYNCIECDFFLHEVCANLPRKLDHALHKHPLFVDPHSLYDTEKDLSCSTCSRFSSGFMYKCREKECIRTEPFQVDINCILVSECFTHKSHEEHPLFISTSYKAGDKVLCHSCKKTFGGYHLHCTICKFAICYACATIPDEIYYKYDEHPLSLCYGKSSGVDDDLCWCEVCEKTLDLKEWFYTNSKYCTTIHHKCLFGDSAYMKPGHVFGGNKVEVVGNGSSSRPICRKCDHHCPYPVYFKVCSWKMSNVRVMFIAYSVICSVRCLLDSPYWQFLFFRDAK